MPFVFRQAPFTGVVGLLFLPGYACFRMQAGRMRHSDIIDAAGKGAARQMAKNVALASTPTTGAVAHDERGNTKYDEEWFGSHCEHPEQPEQVGQAKSQFSSTSEGQQQMKELIEQVNHMSIDGILRHLLSFYVCMRWVPDERFVSALKFELENVNMDSATKASAEEISEEKIFQMYADFDAIPLKCGKAMHVQDTYSIDAFVKAAKTESSGLSKAYRYSEHVAEQSLGFLGLRWGSGGNPKSVKKALADGAHCSVPNGKKKDCGAMGMQQQECEAKGCCWQEASPGTPWCFHKTNGTRDAAENALEILPFDGYIRPSQQFKWFGGQMKHKTHDSQAKNQFFICFGPRVTSFPHKRENGPHVIADMNMAGCNGLWSLEDIVEHVERVKRLFAPELCLTDDLRMKLKEVFLSTFMEMNDDFFQYMTGDFVHETGAIEAIPRMLRESGVTIQETTNVLAAPAGRGTPYPLTVKTLPLGTNIVLAGYAPNSPSFARVVYPVEGWIENWSSKIRKPTQVLLDDEAQGRVSKKYERTARLLAGAHTKWIVCDAKNGKNEEHGFEDNFFRNPKAYAKWLDIEVEKKAPECKLMDPETGCVKCAVSVKSDPWRCTVRLGLEPKHVLDALARGEFPLKSDYRVADLVNQDPGKPPKMKKVKGTCLLGRKPSMNISRNALTENFAGYRHDDLVWAVASDGPDHFTMAPRYTVERRIKAHQEYLQAKREEREIPVPTEQDIMAEVTAMSVWQAQFENSGSTHLNTQLGPRLTFEEHVPQQSNRPSHFVQYIVSCPCEAKDFSELERAETFAGSELTDFFNAGGR